MDMGVYSATKFHFFPAARKLSPSNLGPKNRFFTRKSWPKGLFLKNLGNFKKILGIFRKFLQFWGNFEEFWGIFADFGLILINFKLFPQNPENFHPPLLVFFRIYNHVGKQTFIFFRSLSSLYSGWADNWPARQPMREHKIKVQTNKTCGIFYLIASASCTNKIPFIITSSITIISMHAPCP